MAPCEGDARIGVQQALRSFFDRSHEQDQGFTLTLRGVGLARGATDGRVREEPHCNVLVLLSRADLLAGLPCVAP